MKSSTSTPASSSQTHRTSNHDRRQDNIDIASTNNPILSSSSSTSSLSPLDQFSALPGALARLTLESRQLANQFQAMVGGIQLAHTQLAQLTLEYMRSMDASVRSSASAVDILIDTHTSLIRKMLIAIQQTSSLDQLESQIASTKTALVEIERGVESLLASDAIAAARAQLASELSGSHHARIVNELERENANDTEHEHEPDTAHDDTEIETQTASATITRSTTPATANAIDTSLPSALESGQTSQPSGAIRLTAPIQHTPPSSHSILAPDVEPL